MSPEPSSDAGCKINLKPPYNHKCNSEPIDGFLMASLASANISVLIIGRSGAMSRSKIWPTRGIGMAEAALAAVHFDACYDAQVAVDPANMTDVRNAKTPRWWC